MKRSKMIKLIADFLWHKYPYELCKYADCDANDLLDQIEEAGMLPPHTYIERLPKVEGNKVNLTWDEE